MNTGGRRRPLGPLASGLACCALVVAVLSISLSAGAAHASVDTSKAVMITHSVVTAQLTVRPILPDHVSTTPAQIVALVFTVGFVLVRHRRAVPHHPSRDRRPPRRGPPGPLTYL